MNVLGRVLVAALVVAGIVALGTVVARRSAEVRGRVDTAIEQLTTSPDTPAGTALYGRHRAQREAAFAMQAYLRRLVALDSTASDSMYPLRFLQRAEQLRPDPGNMGPYIRLTPNGWWATIQSMYSTITCAVAVGPDTTIRGAPSGTPVCYTPRVEPDTLGFRPLLQFAATDTTTVRHTSLGPDLEVRVLRQLHANGTPIGWQVIAHRLPLGDEVRNLLFHSLSWHGPHPSDLLAWIHKEQYFPDDRVLPVYGESYDLRVTCRGCTTAGDSMQVHFTAGQIDVSARDLERPHSPPVRP